MKNLFLGFCLLLISAVLFDSCGDESNPTKIITIDTSIQTVLVGNQIWMKKNLDVVTYANGDTIEKYTTDERWREAYNQHIGVWRWNDSMTCKLYNGWVVLDKRGIAPQGYRVPNIDDIINLAGYFNVSFRHFDNDINGVYESNQMDTLMECLIKADFFNIPSGYWHDINDKYTLPMYHDFWLNSEGPVFNDERFPLWIGKNRLYALETMPLADAYISIYPRLYTYAFAIRCLKN